MSVAWAGGADRGSERPLKGVDGERRGPAPTGGGPGRGSGTGVRAIP